MMADAVPAAAVVAALEKAPAQISLAGYAMLALGVLIIIVLAWIFIAAQLDNKSKIDMTDLVIEPSTGKITQAKWHGLIAGAAGTWVFIYLAVSGHFDSTYAAAYLIAMMAAKVAGDITSKPQTPPLPPTGTIEASEVSVRASDPAIAAPLAAPVAPGIGKQQSKRKNKSKRRK